MFIFIVIVIIRIIYSTAITVSFKVIYLKIRCVLALTHILNCIESQTKVRYNIYSDMSLSHKRSLH